MVGVRAAGDAHSLPRPRLVNPDPLREDPPASVFRSPKPARWFRRRAGSREGVMQTIDRHGQLRPLVPIPASESACTANRSNVWLRSGAGHVADRVGSVTRAPGCYDTGLEPWSYSLERIWWLGRAEFAFCAAIPSDRVRIDSRTVAASIPRIVRASVRSVRSSPGGASGRVLSQEGGAELCRTRPALLPQSAGSRRGSGPPPVFAERSRCATRRRHRGAASPEARDRPLMDRFCDRRPFRRAKRVCARRGRDGRAVAEAGVCADALRSLEARRARAGRRSARLGRDRGRRSCRRSD